MPTRKVIVLAEPQNTGLVPGSKINVSEVGPAFGELGKKLALVLTVMMVVAAVANSKLQYLKCTGHDASHFTCRDLFSQASHQPVQLNPVIPVYRI